jgi:hypothetical protein
MGMTVLKWVIGATIIVAVDAISRRSTLAGAVLASLPLVSLLSLTWLWVGTRDAELVAQWSVDVLWLVLPSLAFFAVFPLLMRAGWSFGASMGLGILALVVSYSVTMALVARFAGGSGA